MPLIDLDTKHSGHPRRLQSSLRSVHDTFINRITHSENILGALIAFISKAIAPWPRHTGHTDEMAAHCPELVCACARDSSSWVRLCDSNGRGTDRDREMRSRETLDNCTESTMALRALCRDARALRAAASRLASTSDCKAPALMNRASAAYATVPIVPPPDVHHHHPIDTHLLVKDLQKSGMVRCRDRLVEPICRAHSVSAEMTAFTWTRFEFSPSFCPSL